MILGRANESSLLFISSNATDGGHKSTGRKQSGGIIILIIIKKMALSARTLMRERAWSKLIRSLPEGKNFLPVKMPQGEYLTLRTICKRENTYKTGFHYQSSFKKNQVTITKERRFDYDDQSNQQGLQGE